MIRLPIEQAYRIAGFFTYSKDTTILSFLQGHMGRGWVDTIDNPTCAQILVGDFCYYAGDHRSESAHELMKNIPADFTSPHMLAIPQNHYWDRLIEDIYPGKYERYMRYAIKKEKDCFDRVRLQSLINAVPSGFQIVRINEELYDKALAQDPFRDFCSQFLSAEDYVKRGLGFCILHNNEIVSGASSYSIYDEGIEIEIVTKTEYRRNGLAAACAARLIGECLDHCLYPSWDAANKASVSLAEKLGYHFDKEYVTYKISVDH